MKISEHIVTDDLEEVDLKYGKVAMLYHEGHFARDARDIKRIRGIEREWEMLQGRILSQVEDSLQIPWLLSRWDMNFVPTTVATKSGLVPVNAAKQSSTRAATSISTVRHVNTAALKQQLNLFTAEEKGGKNAVKSSACWIWRPTGKVIDHISKDSGSYMPKIFDYVDPQGRLKSDDQGIFDSGCSRHMTGNKSYLTNYQDIVVDLFALLEVP
ncbi:hypothetical protein Tco_0812534 [Tanacetum coccineum]